MFLTRSTKTSCSGRHKTSRWALIPTPQGPGAAQEPQWDTNSNPALPYTKTGSGEALLVISSAEHVLASWQKRGHHNTGLMQTTYSNLPQLLVQTSWTTGLTWSILLQTSASRLCCAWTPLFYVEKLPKTRDDLGTTREIWVSPRERHMYQDAAARERDSRTLCDLYTLSMRWAGCYLLLVKSAQPQLPTIVS